MQTVLWIFVLCVMGPYNDFIIQTIIIKTFQNSGLIAKEGGTGNVLHLWIHIGREVCGKQTLTDLTFTEAFHCFLRKSKTSSFNWLTFYYNFVF